MSKGTFIAFEGIDGSGKSTQVSLLAEKLRKNEIPYYTTMEPTASPTGSLIRQIMTGRIQADNKVIAALFVADRLDHLLNEVDGIAAKVDEGISVITDRYYFSSYAYQSVDISLEWIIKANEPSRAILKPDATIFIDVSPDTAMERIAKNRTQLELFEKKSRLIKVRENYLYAFELLKDTENVIKIDGNQRPEKIASDIWENLKTIF